MKKLLTWTVTTLLSLSIFANDTLESAAIDAYDKSNISQANSPCGRAGEAKSPKAFLLVGGGDVEPIQYDVIVVQEFNCGFASQSILARVKVIGGFDYENFKMAYSGDQESVILIQIKDLLK